MQQNKKSMGLLIRALLFIGLSASAFAMDEGLKQEKKTVIYCSEASPETFNPMLSASLPTLDASSETIYNRLLQLSKSSDEIDAEGGLAKRYTVSDDGRRYTFELRQNVSFQSNKYFTPTRFFNADDVIFTFERQAIEEHPYHKIGNAQYLYFQRNMADNFQAIRKIDDYTVEIELKHADPQFPVFLALGNGSIQSAEYAQKMLQAGTPEVIDLYPIGTGAFQLVNYEKDATIRYKAFDDYWAGREKIDYLIFSITPDASVRVQKMLTRECDIMAYPNPMDVKKLQEAKHINVLLKPSLNTGYLAFNGLKAPLSSKKVRQALSYAINKQKIVAAIYNDSAKVANNILPLEMKYYDQSLNPYPYDPEKAKKLLTEAGYAQGFETSIWAMPVARPYNPNARRMAEMIQADLAAIGVRAKIVTFEWAEYLKRARAGEHDMILIGWAALNTEPENFLEMLLTCKARSSGTNYANFCQPEYEALLAQALAANDLKERERLFKQLQALINEEQPLLPIAHSFSILPINKRIKNFQIGVFQQHNFTGLDVIEDAGN